MKSHLQGSRHRNIHKNPTGSPNDMQTIHNFRKMNKYKNIYQEHNSQYTENA